MSLYNLLHGTTPYTPILLEMLRIDQSREDKPPFPEDAYIEGEGIDRDRIRPYIEECIRLQYWQSGRFRDIWLNEDGSQIILYTRNGGGNRTYYHYIFAILRRHPNYLDDWDDDGDNTYAYISFSIPEEYKEFCKGLASGEKLESVSEKFKKTLTEMSQMDKEAIGKDKRFASVMEILKRVLGEEK